jgi:hypothetical protein
VSEVTSRDAVQMWKCRILPTTDAGSAFHCCPKTAVGSNVMESRPSQLCVLPNVEQRDVRIIIDSELEKHWNALFCLWSLCSVGVRHLAVSCTVLSPHGHEPPTFPLTADDATKFRKSKSDTGSTVVWFIEINVVLFSWNEIFRFSSPTVACRQWKSSHTFYRLFRFLLYFCTCIIYLYFLQKKKNIYIYMSMYSART